MPNFVCDICGGAIKMQANRTGVCQTCGMEYDIEAIRAMANVSAAPTMNDRTPAPVPAPAETQRSNEIDRDALLIYLNDVRTMETILKETEKKKLRMAGEETKLKTDITNCENKEPPYEYNEKEHEYIMGNEVIGLICGGIGILGLIFYLIIRSDENPETFYGVSFALLSVLFFVSLIIIRIKKMKVKETNKIIRDNYAKAIESRNQFYAYWRSQATQKRNAFYSWKTGADKIIIEMTDEQKTIANDLDKAYSANIIPMQFRNIEGVYYLYDYLSTSNQSLSEALMQANLEAIKQRLDEIIEKQSAQIVLQAQANAKLDEVISRNRKILETAQATMNNTAIAAKYAQITAVNTELTARLASQSLAYQRVDFWLK